MHGSVADTRNLLLLVEDDAIVQELLLQWAEMQIVTHMPCNCTTEVKR